MPAVGPAGGRGEATEPGGERPDRERPGGERVAVVLAAGKGTRMRSRLPKVLHRAAGRPLLAWVLDAARAAGCGRLLVVVGHGAEQVRAAIVGDDLTWVVQAEQRGTGHALAQVADRLGGGAARLLVLSGDVPLLSAATLERLLAAAGRGWGAMAVADLRQPGGLGRVVARAGDGDGVSAAGRPGTAAGKEGDGAARRAGTAAGMAGDGTGASGRPGAATGWDGERRGASCELLERIVEAADATPAELELRTVNAGLYALPAPDVFFYLAALTPANAQGEIYLTDALTAAAAAGRRIELVRLEDPREAQGVNDRRELAAVHRSLLDRHLDALMSSGVTVLEPRRTVVEPTVCVGPDTILHPGVSLLGRTSVGSGCVLHQGAWVRDSRLGDQVTIEPYGLLDGAVIGSGCRVGAGARLAPAPRLLPAASGLAGGSGEAPSGRADDGTDGVDSANGTAAGAGPAGSSGA
ncbi:MAG TPA: NTP transferase domain-containing protein [Thermoanaerobaculia bacterium]|nr:NTP transferase domain-containing protein [Thermoanaerobaculia bacterium]